MPVIDIIGDIHGHADKARRLLHRLGYREIGGIYSQPDHQTIFVGDLIDRGPAVDQVLEIVSGMVRAGSAQVVMGNHEFNALAYHTPDGKGGYLRPHCDKNRSQHSETLAYLDKNPGVLERMLTWFYSFPLWLDLGFVRIVHATWSPSAIEYLRTPYLTPDRLVLASRRGTPEYQAIETLSKGIEAELPVGSTFFDKDGNVRDKIRVRWWLKPDPQRTIAETVFPPDPSLPNGPFTSVTTWPEYGPDQPPVVATTVPSLSPNTTP
jgi:hypothetical protein